MNGWCFLFFFFLFPDILVSSTDVRKKSYFGIVPLITDNAGWNKKKKKDFKNFFFFISSEYQIATTITDSNKKLNH